LAIREFSWLNLQKNINVTITDFSFDYNNWDMNIAKLGLNTMKFSMTCYGFIYPPLNIPILPGDPGGGDWVRKIYVDMKLDDLTESNWFVPIFKPEYLYQPDVIDRQINKDIENEPEVIPDPEPS